MAPEMHEGEEDPPTSRNAGEQGRLRVGADRIEVTRPA